MSNSNEYASYILYNIYVLEPLCWIQFATGMIETYELE